MQGGVEVGGSLLTTRKNVMARSTIFDDGDDYRLARSGGIFLGNNALGKCTRLFQMKFELVSLWNNRLKNIIILQNFLVFFFITYFTVHY